MGWMDAFKPAKTDLSPIRHELRKQEQWIGQLHTYSKDLHNYTSYIHDSNAKHKKEIVEQISGLVKWVDYLNSSHMTLKQEFNDLRHSLRKTLKADFENYHKFMEEYLRLRFEQEKTFREEMAKEMLAEMKSLKKNNADNAKPVTSITHYKEEADLSNPEKVLLNVLFNENKPMTYEDLARKTGKSVNSVRVYMNSLKAKKPIIEEFLTSSGSKVFSVKNSEIVKTLFNIR